MDGRIEHLRSHYRLVGPRTAPALVTRLDRVLPRSGLACYEAALQEALADDESVYVLRRVHAPMTLVLREELTDSALARVWGTRVAKSVLHAIAAAADSPGNLVQFENQADYVAHFLVALLKGTQHGQWFYDAFGELTTLDRESAIKRVLLDNQTHLPLILGYVHRYGALDSLISALDAETKRMLWSADSAQRDDLELGRPLFIMALQFVDQFAGWARVPRDGEELFRDYLETEPQKADWRDPRSLAVAVFEGDASTARVALQNSRGVERCRRRGLERDGFRYGCAEASGFVGRRVAGLGGRHNRKGHPAKSDHHLECDARSGCSC